MSRVQSNCFRDVHHNVDRQVQALDCFFNQEPARERASFACLLLNEEVQSRGSERVLYRMGLVEYSDSEEDQAEPVRKRPRLSNDGIDKTELPPLPAEFHDLYSHAARVSNSDDPSLHGGRKRIVPHVEGNWAAHVYLECKSSAAMCWCNHFLKPFLLSNPPFLALQLHVNSLRSPLSLTSLPDLPPLTCANHPRASPHP